MFHAIVKLEERRNETKRGHDNRDGPVFELHKIILEHVHPKVKGEMR
jgi:hypothetical protein